VLKIVRLEEIHFATAGAQIRAWFAGDAEGNHHLSSYAEPEQWFKLFGPKRHGWFVVADERPIGFIDLEVNEGTGYFAYYVAPEFRGQGYGTATLRLTIEHARELGLTTLEGGVEPDNAASITALKKTGFELQPLDDEGMLPVTRTIEPR
jgi:RimJ/RimL family protein N-acetyltransferase